MRPDGTVNPDGMTSFNHYAFGAVADWMHRVIGGLRREGVGWSEFRVAPRPGGGISSARTSLTTLTGEIVIEWAITGSIMRTKVIVPVGTKAVLDIEGMPVEHLGPGAHTRESERPGPSPSSGFPGPRADSTT
jgi:alpha-L-rhamnosidase